MNDRVSTSDFLRDFIAEEYIDTYYPRDIGKENVALLNFYASTYKNDVNTNKGGRLIEVGGGPTIYQIISASSTVQSIYFSDYSINNINAVKKWLADGVPGIWGEYIRMSLECEKIQSNDESVGARAALLKKKIVAIEQLDIKSSSSVDAIVDRYGKFDFVSSAFCIDSITSSFEQWRTLLNNLKRLLSGGGSLVICTLIGSKQGYRVGSKVFPSVNLTCDDVYTSLNALGFNWGDADAKYIQAESSNSADYQGLLCIKATLKNG